MKYDVTTSHMFTQHWIVDAKDKDQAAEKVANGKIKFDKTSRKFVSDKLRENDVTVDHINRDTFKDKNNFFSYRRSSKLQQKDYGRCVSAVSLL